MKKAVFLFVIALMIGTFGYSQILGGPAYQTERSDRERPTADADIEHIIDFIYLPVNDIQPVDGLHFTEVEFNETMKPAGTTVIQAGSGEKPIYKCFIADEAKPSATSISHQVTCVRVR